VTVGPQGPIGPQGAIGPSGEGNGEQGPKGDTGERGQAGPLDRRVKAAFVVVILVAFVVTSAQGYAIRENRDLIDRMQAAEAEALEAHQALCSFRLDLLGRANRTRTFIEDVEAGERPPIQGVTLNDLRMTLHAQESTLKSLGPLDCTT
jgi:hypothetical protein